MRPPWEWRGRAGPPWIVTFIRAALLALCTMLTALGLGSGGRATWLIVLAGVALLAVVLPQGRGWAAGLAVIESGLAAYAVARTGGGISPLLGYLPAVAFAAGIALGLRGVLLTAATAGAFAGFAWFVELTPATGTQGYVSAAAQWTVIALVLGACGAWVRSVAGQSATTRDRYAEAYRLLDQLRAVTRSLPGSLDPGTAAAALLDRVRPLGPVHRAAVLLHTGERFVPLAVHGARRVPWRPSVDDPGPVGKAWRSQKPVIDRRRPDLGGRRQGSALAVVPMLAGDRAVGLVILESTDHEAFDDAMVDAVRRTAEEATPAIETASLFDELRTSAAAEERSRLAREMHDGIAQDLAYLGYQVDALTRSLEKGDAAAAAEQSRELRGEMSRLTQDLRLSITDLRSSIGPARSLGAALSEYARSAGTGAGLTVHLSLTEEVVRLPADTEVGLLRIAHEAIASARRATGVRNLWVSLVVDPPSYTLDISDDGVVNGSRTGLSQRSAEIMQEIAARIGGVLQVAPRPGGGTAVRVLLEGGVG